MTAREKKLAMIVGGVVLLIGNYLLVEFFLKNRAQLSQELKRKKGELEIRQELLSDKDLWLKRAEWVKAKQPKLANESGAGVGLLEELKSVASKNNVLLESPTIGNIEKRPYAMVVAVNFESKSNWEGLCAFLREVQTPESFVVFEQANIKVDPADKTQMRCRFKAAKWFAPR